MKRYSLRTVLATTDLSEASDASLASAEAMARSHGAHLSILHCVVEQRLAGRAAANQRTVRSARRRDLVAQLKRVFGEGHAHTDLIVRTGNPVEVIARVADDLEADLIVLGPHAPRSAFDDLLGSTADRVLRTAAMPCLLAHRPMTESVRRVLVATDFSRHARRALHVMVDWFGTQGPAARNPDPIEIELLYVAAFASPVAAPRAAADLLEKELAAARNRLHTASTVTFTSSILSSPLEGDGILRAAERSQPDLVALGTHGYGYLSRLLLGSVAYDVVKRVPYPLLLVPPSPGTRTGRPPLSRSDEPTRRSHGSTDPRSAG